MTRHGEGAFKPSDRHGRPLVFGSTRNPFEMYVSLWAYGRSGRGFAADHLSLPYGVDDPQSFQRYIRALLRFKAPKVYHAAILNFEQVEEEVNNRVNGAGVPSVAPEQAVLAP
jgi:hypothetical protein